MPTSGFATTAPHRRHKPTHYRLSTIPILVTTPKMLSEHTDSKHTGAQDQQSWTSFRNKPMFAVYHTPFAQKLSESSLQLCLEEDHPFAHEAGVYIPEQDALFITSNQFLRDGEKVITINRLSREGNAWRREEIKTNVPMANGGINYNGGVLFCSQGTLSEPSALILVEAKPPYRTQSLLHTYHGRRFNSINDVVVKRDGSIWFTDPIYGFEQSICPRPELPSQVYRFDPKTDDIRAVADGFQRPNGLCFSPDEDTMYITDTDLIHGDGNIDSSRVSSIYAFDVIHRHGGTFLANKRLFAHADHGVPDGIKCDREGNVYSGCGDGINIWLPSGTLAAKIIVPGGAANFCFGRVGELFILNEKRFWVAKLNAVVEGALLHNMGIAVD